MPRTIEKVPDKLPPEITSLKNMFTGATSFNQDLSTWDTSNITNMNFTFNGATSINSNITNWNNSNAVYMNFMFYGAKLFDQDLSTWNVKKVTEHSNFANYSGITNPNKLPKFKNNIITIY